MAASAPYGTWESPLSAQDIVEGAAGLAHPCRRGPDWLWEERRPAEQGRVALVARAAAGGAERELLPPTISARTLVHEYGGRCWAVNEDGLVVTSSFADQRLWAVPGPGVTPVPLTPEPPAPGGDRYASPVISPDGAWVVCVRERHRPEGVLNDLVAVPLAARPAGSAPGPGEPRVLAEGHDFYSSPQFSPEGTELAFICWDHPDMPWDRTQLWRAHFHDAGLEHAVAVVGPEAGESVLEPCWSPTGALCYISDRTGWWNIYEDGTPLAPMAAEFAGPSWAFGDSDYVFLADGTLVATWQSEGRAYLGTIADGRAVALPLPYTSFYGLAAAGPGAHDGVLAVAGSPTVAFELVRIDLQGGTEVVKRSRASAFDEGLVSTGQPFSFPTGDGQRAYGLFYPPHYPAYSGLEDEKPPLIVTSHGGPTGSASPVLNLRAQYWTSRGFAVVDVDYRGSTGYGRDFRRALYGLWGDADVADCAGAARWLAEQAWVDGGRMVIRGASASGLTALAALARYDIFSAATVLYGVGDLAALATGTHKFESRYMDNLVSADQMAPRSPVNNVASINAPVLFLQGLDDKVVPPEQSEGMARSLRQAGVPAFLVEIEGEGHGFRKETTLVRSLEAELAFYAQVLGFSPAGDLGRAVADLRQAGTEQGARW